MPAASYFTRLKETLEDIEAETGAVRAVMTQLVGRLAASLEDFGQDIGFDGKAIESHSTGRKRPAKAPGKAPAPSDEDAAWGQHEHSVTTPGGEQKKVVKRGFGYKFCVLSDVRYEMPIDFRLVAASAGEQAVCQELLDDWIASPLSAATRSFVADKGLDCNELHRTGYEAGILSVIPGRHLWDRKDNPHREQLAEPTRLLESRRDTVVTTEHGDLYCVCPQTAALRRMNCQGYEKVRGTVKWTCPAAAYGFECAGRAQCHELGGVRADAKSRTVRVRIDAAHLRNHNVLPPSTPKWRRTYARRSATERIFSRCDGNFSTDRHYLRGRSTIAFHLTVSLATMLAA